MPQAFTCEQMNEIRQKLFQSACRNAVEGGVRKTSLEMLAQDAGISKSTFYKFFPSKEVLFLKVAKHFEHAVIREMRRILRKTSGMPSRERTAAAVNAAFAKFAELGAVRFFSEDLPLLYGMVPHELAKDHVRNIGEQVVEVLEEEKIRFSQPRQTVLDLIHLLYRTIPAMADMDHFMEAFRILVLGVCSQVVA